MRFKNNDYAAEKQIQNVSAAFQRTLQPDVHKLRPFGMCFIFSF